MKNGEGMSISSFINKQSTPGNIGRDSKEFSANGGWYLIQSTNYIGKLTATGLC